MTVDEMLAFEREWANRPANDGRKSQAIQYRWGLSETTYYQRLNSVLDTRGALEADAMTTRLLQRRRGRSARSRRHEATMREA